MIVCVCVVAGGAGWGANAGASPPVGVVWCVVCVGGGEVGVEVGVGVEVEVWTNGGKSGCFKFEMGTESGVKYFCQCVGGYERFRRCKTSRFV